MLQYSVWAGFDEDSDEFWSSNATRQMYKDHMLAMVNRTNTLTGKASAPRPCILLVSQSGKVSRTSPR